MYELYNVENIAGSILIHSGTWSYGPKLVVTRKWLHLIYLIWF